MTVTAPPPAVAPRSDRRPRPARRPCAAPLLGAGGAPARRSWPRAAPCCSPCWSSGRCAGCPCSSRPSRSGPGRRSGSRSSAARRSWPPRGSPARSAPVAAGLVVAGDARALPAGRRAGRRVPAAGPLGHAGGRRRPRPRGAARHQRALPGAGRVDPPRASPRAAPPWWPARPRSRCGRGATGASGYPLPALVLLVALAVVPAVVLAFEGEFVLGARPQPARARLPAAGEAAPARRARRRRPSRSWPPSWRSCSRPPWTAASRGGTTRRGRCPPRPRARPRSRWDHDYSPLDWPRDGRELLRVQARQPAYWKAQDLDAFAGGGWLAARLGRPARELELPPRPGRGRALEPGHPGDGPQPPHADLRRGRRGVRRRATCPRTRRRPRPAPACSRPRARSRAATPTARRSTRRARPTRQLRLEGSGGDDVARGLPSPVRQRRRAGGREPAARHGDRLPELGRGRCAADGAPGAPGRRGAARRRHRAARPGRPGAHPRASRSACAPAPTTPFEYVERVERHLEDGFTYSETPPRAAEHARRLPVRREGGLLPAVQRGDGAAAAHGRRARARRRGLHDRRAGPDGERVRRARPRRPLLGRGVVPRRSAG